MSEVTVKEKVDTRIHESDLPPRVYRPIPEDYRPTLTRTYATPSYVRHELPPPKPPQVPAREAEPEEIPDVAAKLVEKMEGVGWRTKVVYSVHADGKAETTILARRVVGGAGQATMVSWTVNRPGGVLKASARTNMLWPHRGRPTSMLGATEWARIADVGPAPKKKRVRRK